MRRQFSIAEDQRIICAVLIGPLTTFGMSCPTVTSSKQMSLMAESPSAQDGGGGDGDQRDGAIRAGLRSAIRRERVGGDDEHHRPAAAFALVDIEIGAAAVDALADPGVAEKFVFVTTVQQAWQRHLHRR